MSALRRHLPSSLFVLFLVLLTFFMAIAVPAPANAAVIVVNTTNDELNNDGDCSLREAIQTANTNLPISGCVQGAAGPDIITLPAGTYTLSIAGAGEDDNQTGDLDISESLTINGGGMATTIVNGGTLDRVFHIVDDSAVVFNDFTIENGRAPEGTAGNPGADGGGIYNNGDLTLDTVTLDDNVAGRGGANERGGHGGGIYHAPSAVNLNVSGSTISRNGAGSSGMPNTMFNAAAGGDGGGLYISAPAAITGSTIFANFAGDGANSTTNMVDPSNGGRGGGMFVGPIDGFNIDNSLVDLNESGSGGNCLADLCEAANGGGGAGIFVADGATNATLGPDLTVSNGFTGAGGDCLAAGCPLPGIAGDGGGIYLGTGATALIQDALISGNLASLNGSQFNGAQLGGGKGGGIYSDALDGTVTGSVVADNTAEGRGGGIYEAGLDFLLEDSIVARNEAQFVGGGVSAFNYLTVRGSTISENRAISDGGGLIFDQNDLFVINSTISLNFSESGVGGGILSYGSITTTRITNSTVTKNAATIGSGVYNLDNGTMTIDNSILAGNGNDDCSVGSGTVSGQNNLIQSAANDCGLGGGGGNITGADPLLSPLAFYGGPTPTHALMPGSQAIDNGQNGLAVDESNLALTSDQRGAGFPRIVGGTVDIGAYEFHSCPSFPITVSNEAELNLAILCYNALTTPGTYTILLDADIPLGASTTPIDNDMGGVELVIEGQGHTVDGQGGVNVQVFRIQFQSDVTMNGITVTGGNTPNVGAGIFNSGTLTLADSAVIGNTSETAGGGIFSNSTLIVLRSVIAGNSTTTTSAFGLGGAGINNEGTTTIIESTVSGNVTASDGGGILSFGNLTVLRSTIAGNNATREGGGIWAEQGFFDSENYLINSTVSGNSADIASGAGGGLYNNVSDGTFIATNSTFSDNAASDGGGIYNSSSGNVAINNSIVANSQFGGDCVDQSGGVSGDFNLIEDAANDCGLGGVGSNITGIDPLLVGLQDNGGPTHTHALSQFSSAINAGQNALALNVNGVLLTTDQRGAGFPRIAGGTVDIGAYEAPAGVDLQLQKFVKPDGWTTTGEPFDFIIFVDNLSEDYAYDVTVDDTLFSSGPYTLQSVDDDRDACNVATPQDGDAGATLPFACTLEQLEPGGRWTIHATVVADRPVDVNNEARVSSETADPDQSNNFDSAAMRVRNPKDPQSGLTVFKQVSAGKPVSGELHFYTIEVTNHEDFPMENVVLEDDMTGSVDFIFSPDAECVQTVSGNQDSAECQLGELAPGETRIVHLYVETKAKVREGHISDNEVWVHSTTLDGQNNPYSGYDQVFMVYGNVHDLLIRKFGKPDGAVEEGQLLKYTLVIDNFGPGYAYDVEVRDLIASDGSYSFEAPSFCAPKTGQVDGNQTITCKLGTIVPGEQRSFQVEITAKEAQSINNQADVRAEGHDLYQANNHAFVQHDVKDVADVGVSIVAGTDIVVSGEELLYTINITNNGPSRALNVNLRSALSENAQVVDIDAGSGGCNILSVFCELGHIDPGDTVVVTMMAATNPALTSQALIFNDVMVSADTHDGNRGNNLDFARTPVRAVRRLSLGMSSSAARVEPGEAFTLSLRALNNGQGLLEKVRVDVALSPYLEYIADTSGCGPALTGCALGDIVTGQEKGFDIVVRVAGNAPDGQTAVSRASTKLPADVAVDSASSESSVAIGAAGSGYILLPLVVGGGR